MSTSSNEIYWFIKKKSQQLGFVDFGCAPAGEVSCTARTHYLNSMEKGYFASMTYLQKNLEKRFNPQLLVPGSHSVLVFLAPYSLPPYCPPPSGVAQYALGSDYHLVIKEKLFAIMEEVKQIFPQLQGRAFTDSAPVLEREWAVKASLGWIGKNNFLISKRYGIKNLIGTIICNLELPSTTEIEPEKGILNMGSCGNCSRCIQACPTKALENAFTTDAGKCISYHTIENKNMEEEILLGKVPPFPDNYFGCDKCMDACPWNSRNVTGWGDFHKNYAILSGSTQQWWEGMCQEEFNITFKDSPLMRGGLDKIRTSLEWNKRSKENGKF